MELETQNGFPMNQQQWQVIDLHDKNVDARCIKQEYSSFVSCNNNNNNNNNSDVSSYNIKVEEWSVIGK